VGAIEKEKASADQSKKNNHPFSFSSNWAKAIRKLLCFFG
jgi:hypothetical protein